MASRRWPRLSDQSELAPEARHAPFLAKNTHRLRESLARKRRAAKEREKSMISSRRNCVGMKVVRRGIPCCLSAPVPALRLECLARCHRVFLAHQKFESAAGPC